MNTLMEVEYDMNKTPSKKEFTKIVAESVSKTDICRKLGVATGGTGWQIVSKLIEKYKPDISHLSRGAAQRKYRQIEKTCPVCNKIFVDRQGHSREKKTCSHSCANTFFRSGENNPNYKSEKSEWGYRKICFSHWEKKCILCGFDKVVEVHHLDYNNKNNNKDNLVPLCPNHHATLHTKAHGKLVEEEVSRKLRNVG